MILIPKFIETKREKVKRIKKEHLWMLKFKQEQIDYNANLGFNQTGKEILNAPRKMKKNWVFTFSFTSKYKDNFMRINDTYENAIMKMYYLRKKNKNNTHARQYFSLSDAGVNKFKLTEIILT